MKEHLETFLKEAQSLNPDPMHVKEVCFLCVQCMEVSPRFNLLEMEQFLNVSILGVTKIQSKTIIQISVLRNKLLTRQHMFRRGFF